MSDDERLVPLEDDEVAIDVSDTLVPADVKLLQGLGAAGTASDSRDWSEQGFDENSYDDVPPHWRD